MLQLAPLLPRTVFQSYKSVVEMPSSCANKLQYEPLGAAANALQFDAMPDCVGDGIALVDVGEGEDVLEVLFEVLVAEPATPTQ